jgi:hypothetical protein
MENKYNPNQEIIGKKIFWGEISPCRDLIQMYEEDDTFLDRLGSFVSDGIHSQEATIVIATSSHLRGLENRILLNGINPDAARESNLYIPLDVNETLARFIVYGSPDEASFRQLITGLIERAEGLRIRAFGEMVALLWGQGFKSATMKLEEFCNSYCNDEAYHFFCEYPKYGFNLEAKLSMDNICRKHSEVAAEWNKQETAKYRDTAQSTNSVA